jgi:hypothetical protein
MPSNAAYLLYGKIPIPTWEIMYPETETCIRSKASFGSGPQSHPTIQCRSLVLGGYLG